LIEPLCEKQSQTLRHCGRPVVLAIKRRRQIAKEKAYENIKYVRGVVEQHIQLDIVPTWDALDELRQDRNLIAHGVWMMRFGGEATEDRSRVATRSSSPTERSRGRHCRHRSKLRKRRIM
jgi:hypothetical protein